MDPLRDTPLKRFGAYWIGLFILFSFGIALLILSPILNKEKEDPILKAQYAKRLEIKAEVDAAQQSQLVFKQSGDNAQVAPEYAFDYTAKQLLDLSPMPTSIVVPGSETDLNNNAN